MPPAMPRRKPDIADGRAARRSDPPYMAWRDGRPIWNPGPELRRQGWTAIPLKGADGQYLGRAMARQMAREILTDVTRWRGGEAPRHFAPGEAPALYSPDAADRTLNAAWERFQLDRQYRGLAPATRNGYRKDLRRFLDFFGAETPQTVDRTTLNAWYEFEFDRIFALRELGWREADIAAAPRQRDPDGAAFIPQLRQRRDEAMDEARANACNVSGQAQMAAIIRAVSRLYTYILDELRWKGVTANPASRFQMRGLKPRLRLPTDEELACLVETADDMGLPSIGDALVMLANMGVRIADLTDMSLTGLDSGRIQGVIRKTGARADVRLTRAVRRRITEIRTRRTGQAPRRAAWPDRYIATDATHTAYTRDHLETQFDRVRREAASKRASVADLVLYDFRKKAITRLHAAGNSRDDISAVTKHSYKTIDTILDHYIVPTREAADRSIDRLDTYMHEKGLRY